MYEEKPGPTWHLNITKCFSLALVTYKQIEFITNIKISFVIKIAINYPKHVYHHCFFNKFNLHKPCSVLNAVPALNFWQHVMWSLCMKRFDVQDNLDYEDLEELNGLYNVTHATSNMDLSRADLILSRTDLKNKISTQSQVVGFYILEKPAFLVSFPHNTSGASGKQKNLRFGTELLLQRIMAGLLISLPLKLVLRVAFPGKFPDQFTIKDWVLILKLSKKQLEVLILPKIAKVPTRNQRKRDQRTKHSGFFNKGNICCTN